MTGMATKAATFGALVTYARPATKSAHPTVPLAAINARPRVIYSEVLMIVFLGWPVVLTSRDLPYQIGTHWEGKRPSKVVIVDIADNKFIRLRARSLSSSFSFEGNI